MRSFIGVVVVVVTVRASLWMEPSVGCRMDGDETRQQQTGHPGQQQQLRDNGRGTLHGNLTRDRQLEREDAGGIWPGLK